MIGEVFSSCERSQKFAESRTSIIKCDVPNQVPTVLWVTIMCFWNRLVTGTCYLWLPWYYFSYRQNAQKFSRLFRDRPQTPLETAIFWTEYVIRHGGAPHLRSAALDLAWYQYLLLDVIAVIVLSIAIVLGTMYFICRKIISILFKSVPKKLKETWRRKNWKIICISQLMLYYKITIKIYRDKLCFNIIKIIFCHLNFIIFSVIKNRMTGKVFTKTTLFTLHFHATSDKKWCDNRG